VTSPRIDVHAHLAGTGAGGSGCRVSPSFRRSLAFRAISRLHGIREDEHGDAVWAERLAAHVRGSEVDYAVALGFDGVYDASGALDEAASQMVVPPEWVFEVCRVHSELLPGPSIHPGRRGALELLEASLEQGAVLLKWLPATQGIDPAKPAYRAFYQRMADARLPLLVHSGGSENTFAEVDPALKSLDRLRLPLSMGVPVIVAHLAARVAFRRDPDEIPLLRRMLAEFPHLWLDNSGMCNPARSGALARGADDPELAERTLHGSDFPVPCNAIWFPRRIRPRRVLSLERISNPLQRDLSIKRALGWSDAPLGRGSEVLRDVRRWTGGDR
jgi:uncharacterized protein